MSSFPLTGISDQELTEKVAALILGWTLTGTDGLGRTVGVPPEALKPPETARLLPDVLGDWNCTREMMDRIGQIALAGTFTSKLQDLLGIEFDDPPQHVAYDVLYADQRTLVSVRRTAWRVGKQAAGRSSVWSFAAEQPTAWPPEREAATG